ncbi:MAG TPA: dynein regulation protein LC7 [Micromonosporaceae bacterium]|nr:dynein regulation protein LC7 [Micromonosporaceae bacterium]
MTTSAADYVPPMLHEQVGFLLRQFTSDTPGVAHAIVVSVDGLVLAYTESMAPEQAERVAAIVAGLGSLADGASKELGGGPVETSVVGMTLGNLLVLTASNGARLAVLSSVEQDIGHVSYCMQLFVDQVGEVALKAEARHGL